MPSPLAIAGTFLLTAAFFAATLHVAVRWVVGAGPAWKALLAAPLPAAAVFVLEFAALPRAAVLAGVALTDLFAIATVYDLGRRRAVLLTAVHVVITVALSLALVNLWLAASG